MSTPLITSSTPEIRVRLEAVVRYLYTVTGPEDEMLQVLVRRLHGMTPSSDLASCPEGPQES